MGPSGFCVFNGSVAGWNANNRTFGHEQLLYCSSQSGSMPVGSWWFIATLSQSRCWGSQTVRPCRRMTPWAMAIFLANEIRWISTNWGLCWWLLNYALHPKTVDSSSPPPRWTTEANFLVVQTCWNWLGDKFCRGLFSQNSSWWKYLIPIIRDDPIYVKDPLQRYSPPHYREVRGTARSYTRSKAVEQRLWRCCYIGFANGDQKKGLIH